MIDYACYRECRPRLPPGFTWALDGPTDRVSVQCDSWGQASLFQYLFTPKPRNKLEAPKEQRASEINETRGEEGSQTTKFLDNEQ